MSTSPNIAHAQDADELKDARSKFQRAIELKQAKDYRGALKLFRDVGLVKMTPQVRYHIASCEENLGKLVIALGGYELALAQAEEMHPDFISEVQTSIDGLKARIPKLVLERGPGAEAATIEVDGVALGANTIGTETPLDPGPHTVTAKAPGFADYRETVTVTEGKVEVLTVSMTELASGKEQPASSTEPEEKSFGALPYVLGGTGLAIAGAGGLFLGLSSGKVGAAKDLCGGTDCRGASADDQEEAETLVNTASTFEMVGWIGLGVGVAVLATGTTLLIVDKNRASDSSAGVSFVPAAPRSDAGFSLVGRF